MKIADSFAYLQMAHHFVNGSLEGFGNGWFGFLYSAPIAVVSLFVSNDMFASFVVNTIFFNILIGISYVFGKNFLNPKYNFLFLSLVFLSPILLHYNIHILSENIYIPLFFMLFIWVLNYRKMPSGGNAVFLWLMLAFLYFTRAEAFIYLGSIGLIFGYLWLSGKQSFGKTLTDGLTIILTFFVCIFPYLFYMHSFTGEWGLTNKGSSNLRQADLRGVSKMDDDGFEQAVGELRPDNHGLIAWFAWGLKYEKPVEGESFKNYLLKNPQKVVERIGENQEKLFTQNLPHLAVWNAFKLYEIPGSKLFYNNPLYFIILMIPIMIIFWGMIALVRDRQGFVVGAFWSFFLTASVFFTLFFVLDRYFVIFVPFFIFFFVYGVQSIKIENIFWEWIKFLGFWGLYLGIFALWILSYYNTFAGEDAKYEVKKDAGEYLKTYHFSGENLKIMERFPVVTYYAWTKERWLTPYTDKVENLVEYARYNKIDYLVVDSIDFATYRPDLIQLLQVPKNYPGLTKFKEFEKNGEKVVIYKIER